MSVFLSPIGNAQIMNGSLPASGCKLFAYISGSTTKQNTYTTNTGNMANANPIILDQNGNVPSEIWLSQGISYKFVLAPSNDTDPPQSPIWTKDTISGVNDVSAPTQSEWVTGPTPTYISATQFSVAGDQRLIFDINREVKASVTAGTTFSSVSASSYASGTTTVTLNSGVLDSGLSGIYYALLDAANPSIPAQFARQDKSNTFTQANTFSGANTFPAAVANGQPAVMGSSNAGNFAVSGTSSGANAGSATNFVTLSQSTAGSAVAKPARAFGVTYTNNTSRMMVVMVTPNAASTNIGFTIYILGVVVGQAIFPTNFTSIMTICVPPGATYEVANTTNAATIATWAEVS